MSEGMNRVFLVGNIGADPELRHTQGGQAVLNLRIATTESRYIKEKDKREEFTEWHNVKVWGARGEALSRFLAKGMHITIEGSLRTNTYEKNGERRSSTEVVANNVFTSGGGKKGSQSQDDEPPPARQQQRRGAPPSVFD